MLHFVTDYQVLTAR